MESRRGFLIGAAKLIASGLTLAAVPTALAKSVEPLIWTPDRDIIDPRSTQRVDVVAPYGPLYVTVHRGSPDKHTILNFAVAPGCSTAWDSGVNGNIVFADGARLQRITVFADVVPAAAWKGE